MVVSAATKLGAMTDYWREKLENNHIDVQRVMKKHLPSYPPKYTATGKGKYKYYLPKTVYSKHRPALSAKYQQYLNNVKAFRQTLPVSSRVAGSSPKSRRANAEEEFYKMYQSRPVIFNPQAASHGIKYPSVNEMAKYGVKYLAPGKVVKVLLPRYYGMYSRQRKQQTLTGESTGNNVLNYYYSAMNAHYNKKPQGRPRKYNVDYQQYGFGVKRRGAMKGLHTRSGSSSRSLSRSLSRSTPLDDFEEEEEQAHQNAIGSRSHSASRSGSTRRSLSMSPPPLKSLSPRTPSRNTSPANLVLNQNDILRMFSPPKATTPLNKSKSKSKSKSQSQSQSQSPGPSNRVVFRNNSPPAAPIKLFSRRPPTRSNPGGGIRQSARIRKSPAATVAMRHRSHR